MEFLCLNNGPDHTATFWRKGLGSIEKIFTRREGNEGIYTWACLIKQPSSWLRLGFRRGE